jgi:phenylpropionate dioxygenase-like ring-hydroxylating dioxygenase large terminal subunit
MRPQSYQHLFKPGFVHRDLYVDPAIFDHEMRDLFGGTWIYVGHESEIPNRNDFVSRTIGRRPMVLTRTGDESFAVFINRCTHRGALVCRAARGNAPRFTCGYHAWTFANDGRCIGIPLRHGYAADYKLAEANLATPAQVDSYRGFVFASMTAEVPPLTEHLGGARTFLDEWIDRGDGKRVIVAGDMPFNVHANWKTVYDNAGDGYHPPFSHESMLRVFGRRYGDVDMQYFDANFDESEMFIRDLGSGHTMIDQRPSMHKDSAWARQHVQPGREVLEAELIAQHGRERALTLLEASTGSGMNLNIFPNLLVIGNQIQLIEPIAVDRTVIHWFGTTLDGAPDEINAVRVRMQEDFPSFGEVDDAANWESCQHGLATVPELEWVDIRRHMDSGAGRINDDGHWREPISSDRHMRAYFARWQQIMEAASRRALAA